MFKTEKTQNNRYMPKREFSLFHGAHRLAERMQEKYPVRTSLIPDGAQYQPTGKEMTFRRNNLVQIRKFSSRLEDNEFRSKALNHVHFMTVSDMIFAVLAARAQEKSPIDRQSYREFNLLLRGVFQLHALPYNVMRLEKGIMNGEYVPDTGNVRRLAGWKFVAFAAALKDEAVHFRHSYSSKMSHDRVRYEKFMERNQPEHTLAHAVLLTTGICCKIGDNTIHAHEKKMPAAPVI